MDTLALFILAVVLIAYLFDFINGFHDAANSIATIVATGVLTPRQAVLWAALFNFLAFMIFNLTVAQTIGKDLVQADLITTQLIFSALIGAISWNLLTWYLGIPSSSSHALIGGLAGAAIVEGGASALIPSGFIKVGIGIFISPVMGLVLGLLLSYTFVAFASRQPENRLARLFKGLQMTSSAMLSLSHGGNDAQKTMGIIAVLLFSNHWLSGQFYVPWWVIISCQAVISLGTMAGGWRIVHTMGHKITQLNPLRGCAAETGAAIVIYISSLFGIPVSTTHCVTGAIAGVGLLGGLKGTHWPILEKIALSWIITIPASGLIAALLMMSIPH